MTGPVSGVAPSGGGEEGVRGESSTTWAAVAGYNTVNGPGLWGIGGPKGGEGVHGESRGGGWAGVTGIGNAEGGEGVHGESRAAGWAGVTGIGPASGGEGVHGESHSGFAAVAGYGQTIGAGLWGVGGPNGGEGVHAESHSGSGAVAGFAKGTGPAGYFEGTVEVKGNLSVSGDVFLEGQDYAEALRTTDPDVAAGSVVVLGPDGELHLCDEEYDSTVAGIVSGAQGVKPALVLGRCPESAPVALMGTVWCLADASAAPIRPGDLLTTAATPGHCRRVVDIGRAFGAVIGKALTTLPSGRGYVQVFVSPR